MPHSPFTAQAPIQPSLSASRSYHYQNDVLNEVDSIQRVSSNERALAGSFLYTPVFWADALRKSLLFYRAQRSGDLGPTGSLPWRTAPSFLRDGADVGVDLSKGYFDAGDYIKYAQPAAYSMAVLAWGAIEFPDGLERSGQLSELHRAIRWGTDFILRSATHIAHNCTYYAQVGRGASSGCSEARCKYDHGYWGRPEDYYTEYPFAGDRRTYAIDSRRPGTEVWAQASAALASAAIVFTRTSNAYSSRLLATAKTLYRCAKQSNPSNALLQDSLPEVEPQYKSWGFSDELGWAAAWLYDATKEAAYAADFELNMRRGEDRWFYEGFGASWDDLNVMAKLKMLTAMRSYVHAEHLHMMVHAYVSKWVKCNGDNSGPVQTGCGLCFLQKWAPLRYSLTSALVAVVYEKHFLSEASDVGEWAMGQLRYAFGDNPFRISYMIGVDGGGELRTPRKPHHRSSSCPPKDEGECSEGRSLCGACDSPWVLYGAMVGGPDETDCWNDDRANYVRNEVALDYNAPLPALLSWAATRTATTARSAIKLTPNHFLEFRQRLGECVLPPHDAGAQFSCPSGEATDDNPRCPFKYSPCKRK
uniref:Endoglucanase n=1 Tax=Chrysotila carterae TaxID=13221 RepID=A0A7S4BTL1_CHRCT